MHEAQGEVAALCKLLTATARHSSSESLAQALRMATAYQGQALSPSAVPLVADSSPPAQPSSPGASGSKQGALSINSKPGIVGAAVHAVGSIFHTALGSSTSSASSTTTASSRVDPTADPDKGVAQGVPLRGSDSPSGSGSPRILANGRSDVALEAHHASTAAQDESSAVHANGNSGSGPAEGNAGPVGNGSVLPASIAPEENSEQLHLQQRVRAVQFHDALMAGVADRVGELAPEHTFTW